MKVAAFVYLVSIFGISTCHGWDVPWNKKNDKNKPPTSNLAGSQAISGSTASVNGTSSRVPGQPVPPAEKAPVKKTSEDDNLPLPHEFISGETGRSKELRKWQKKQMGKTNPLLDPDYEPVGVLPHEYISQETGRSNELRKWQATQMGENPFLDPYYEELLEKKKKEEQEQLQKQEELQKKTEDEGAEQKGKAAQERPVPAPPAVKERSDMNQEEKDKEDFGNLESKDKEFTDGIDKAKKGLEDVKSTLETAQKTLSDYAQLYKDTKDKRSKERIEAARKAIMAAQAALRVASGVSGNTDSDIGSVLGSLPEHVDSELPSVESQEKVVKEALEKTEASLEVLKTLEALPKLNDEEKGMKEKYEPKPEESTGAKPTEASTSEENVSSDTSSQMSFGSSTQSSWEKSGSGLDSPSSGSEATGADEDDKRPVGAPGMD
ncbi:signal peptide containing protein [Theileria equi strain WA]|uniref:Signal peptide containing protein n=1 Tax=Theileria equi strain WA TaxID=1537102 RepID=L1LBW2_THEEQ|nr:signal peptide containing protein [Theileria equi strain WA]EKX72749.1 signal peptide containing protein [Theileria equi strain WA]|eukprot:XP_004832201.1 signal peptide containing protein [Theileria equi strain WA]